MTSIELENVTMRYEPGAAAVNDICLRVDDGEFFVLVGPSGCGKSTLLRLLAGLERPDSGAIRMDGRDVTDLSSRRRDIAMVFQNYAIYPHMSVRRNMGYGLRVRGASKQETDARVAEVAGLLGLEKLLDRRPGTLSGGQLQRVAMGRAIARRPRVYLMDEPLSNLDAKLRVTMRAELERLHRRLGVTTVYVTHDQVEAMTLGQRAAVLRGGVIQQVDTPQRLYERPANAFVAAFIGSPPMNFAVGAIREGVLELGGLSVPLPDGLRPDVPEGRPILAGIRPEDVREPGAADGIPVRAECVVRQDLGADALLFLAAGSAPGDSAAIERITHSEDRGAPADDPDGRLLCARVGAAFPARAGEHVELAVAPAALHFFDLDGGERLPAARPALSR